MTTAAEVRKAESVMNPPMSGGEYDNLYQLVMHGPREAGEIPSKATMDSLVELGYVKLDHSSDKCWSVTSKGIDAFVRQYLTIEDPHHKIFGAMRVCFAEITGVGWDGTPLYMPIGDIERAKLDLKDTLVLSRYYGSHDYVTFDYIDAEGKRHLMKPGDWLIMHENSTFTLHQFSKDE